jgi:cobalt-zinc-cadmium resistance protein CzcA
MPTMDEGDLIVQVMKLPSITLEQSVQTDLAIQRALLEKVPEIRDIVARAGSDELGLDPMGLNDTDTFLVLKPIAEWRQPDKEWLTDEIRKALADFPGIDTSYTQPIEMRVSEMLTGTRGDLAIKVYGTDLKELKPRRNASRAAEDLARRAGCADGEERRCAIFHRRGRSPDGWPRRALGRGHRQRLARPDRRSVARVGARRRAPHAAGDSR